MHSAVVHSAVVHSAVVHSAVVRIAIGPVTGADSGSTFRTGPGTIHGTVRRAARSSLSDTNYGAIHGIARDTDVIAVPGTLAALSALTGRGAP
ncbi:hypothetical protein ACH4SK_39185 [Streptomyces inhibens]|uniref:hypothetical protein n=1 Tax=Streptomyces inhibens TaxID=2293571 RepID=UPI00378895A8